jgi:hypothetical protein
VLALGWSQWSRKEKFFWSLCAAIPLLLVPAADAYFGYFLAARQMIFALVPISILLAACMEIRWAWVFPAALVFAMVYEDVHWIRRPGEGWQTAAVQLATVQLKDASCTMFVPTGARTMYTFFEPTLAACDEGSLPTYQSVALAVSPDQPSSEARQKLDRAGFRKVADLRIADPRIEVYRR